jgi:hypothetical protein
MRVKNHQFSFALSGSIMTIVFLFLVNQLSSSDYVWFYHAIILLLQWPISIFFAARGRLKLHAVVNSALLIGYLVLENGLHSPGHPWSIYAAFTIIWWPIIMLLGRYRKSTMAAVLCSIGIISGYSLLNASLSPAFPWAIFPSFAILWWPLAMFCKVKRQWFLFSILGTLLSGVFFITVNAITSTDIWAIYPVFAMTWWPLSMYYYHYKATPRT